MGAATIFADASHFPDEDRRCQFCNSFQGVGPLLSYNEHKRRAAELKDSYGIHWIRKFVREHIIWADLERSASSCHCCEVIRTGVQGCLQQHGIEPDQVAKMKFEFLYPNYAEDEDADSDPEIMCELFDGCCFQVQFFVPDGVYTILGYNYVANSSDDYSPCPDAWESAPVGLRTSPRTDSEEAFDKCRSWIEECTTGDHGYCVAPVGGALPTRVVDVGRQTSVIRLIETNGLVDSYLALSHCWGSKQIITTTKDTLKDRKLQIHICELSRTFNDAVTMTRRLGFDYIWIDSLCIVQDDPLDWERESAKMAYIYKGAYLTLAATRSLDGSGGLFTETPDFEVQGVTPEGEDYVLYFRETVEHDVTMTQTHREHFPLLTRAWVCQERLLSPRTIHFSHYEIRYECQSSEDCECGGVGYMNQTSIPLSSIKLTYAEVGSVQSPENQHGISYSMARTWRTVVSYYTELKLTVMSDRLPALSGIARDIAERMNGVYLAGLWEGSLLDDLLWMSNGGSNITPVRWRAPTWSWASVENGVYYSDSVLVWAEGMSEEREVGEDFTKIEHCECIPAGLDKFGKVKSGTLRLAGPMVDGILDHGTDTRGRAGVRLGGTTSRIWQDYTLSRDGPHQVLPGAEVCCLWMRRISRRLVGLILRRAALSPTSFERIGLINLLNVADTQPFLASAVSKTVDIV